MTKIRSFVTAMLRAAVRWARGYPVHVPESVYQERIQTCRACPFVLWKARLPFCSRCSCCMAVKARLNESECPVGNWSRY